MIVTKARDNQLTRLTRELALWLMKTPRNGKDRGLIVYVIVLPARIDTSNTNIRFITVATLTLSSRSRNDLMLPESSKITQNSFDPSHRIGATLALHRPPLSPPTTMVIRFTLVEQAVHLVLRLLEETESPLYR